MAVAKLNDNKAKYKAMSGCLSDPFRWTLKTLLFEEVWWSLKICSFLTKVNYYKQINRYQL